jgi:hypothetical protein
MTWQRERQCCRRAVVDRENEQRRQGAGKPPSAVCRHSEGRGNVQKNARIGGARALSHCRRRKRAGGVQLSAEAR